MLHTFHCILHESFKIGIAFMCNNLLTSRYFDIPNDPISIRHSDSTLKTFKYHSGINSCLFKSRSLEIILLALYRRLMIQSFPEHILIIKATLSFRKDWLGLSCLVQLPCLHVLDYHNCLYNERWYTLALFYYRNVFQNGINTYWKLVIRFFFSQ